MTEPLILLAVLAVATVLVLSGAAKIGHRAETERALDAFRLPAPRLHPAVAAALPAAELVLATGLLLAPAPLYTVVAGGAVALTAVFLGLAISVRVRGATVECACFGGLTARPVGRGTLVRNTVLLAASVVALVGGTRGALFDLPTLDRDEWLVLLATAVSMLALLLVLVTVRSRTGGRSPATVDSPNPARAVERGAEWPVPDLEITGPTGDSIELASLAAERPVLLVLLSAECTPCARVAEQLPVWQSGFGDAVRIVVLTSASRAAFERAYPGLDAPVHHGYRSLLVAAGIPGVPSALLLSTRRTVAAGPAVGLDEVGALAAAITGLARADAPPAAPHREPHDDEAPALTGPR